MARVIWSTQAIEQLNTIVSYVELHDPGAARRLAGRLFAAAESLADFLGAVAPPVTDRAS